MVDHVGGALVLFTTDVGGALVGRVGGALVLITTDGGSCRWSSSVAHY